MWRVDWIHLLGYPVTVTALSKHLKETPGKSDKGSQFKCTMSASLEQQLAPADVGRACKVASFPDLSLNLNFTTDDGKLFEQTKECNLLLSSSKGLKR